MVLDLIIPQLLQCWKLQTNAWFHNIDIGQLNEVVLLDLKKAFDTAYRS